MCSEPEQGGRDALTDPGSGAGSSAAAECRVDGRSRGVAGVDLPGEARDALGEDGTGQDILMILCPC